MKVLITGCSGLGKELLLRAPNDIKIIQSNRDMINFNNLEECKDAIDKYRPDWLINCAAYTNGPQKQIMKML